MVEVVRRWALKVQTQSLRVGPGVDIDQILEFGVEATYAVGSAAVAVAFAGDSCDHWIVRTSVLVASQTHSAGSVAVVGNLVVPSE